MAFFPLLLLAALTVVQTVPTPVKLTRSHTFECADRSTETKCNRVYFKGQCSDEWAGERCARTCGYCMDCEGEECCTQMEECTPKGTPHCINMHFRCLFSRLCDFHCEYGTCHDGICECLPGYSGTYCAGCTSTSCIHGTCMRDGKCMCNAGYSPTDDTSVCSPCTESYNGCKEKGGICTMGNCNDGEVHFKDAPCYDDCNDYKCCIPDGSQFFLNTYDKIWESSQCEAINLSQYDGTRSECISLCVNEVNCDVISYNNGQTGFVHCIPRSCDPVPQPTKNFPSYKGYSIDKEKVCEKRCGHGTCEGEICQCDSGFKGRNCRTECERTSDNLCVEKGGVCTMMETCDDAGRTPNSGLSCYDNCDYTCCMPLGIESVYDYIWSEEQCHVIETIENPTLESCLLNCGGHSNCNAINFKNKAGEMMCVILACPEPIPTPVTSDASCYGYRINKVELCEAHCGDHGTCDSGMCQCDTGYGGTYCKKECEKTSDNLCVEKGGECTMMDTCSADRTPNSDLSCYANCDYTCCMPLGIEIVYDKIWSEEQCSIIETIEEESLDDCLLACGKTPNCNAVNYKKTDEEMRCDIIACTESTSSSESIAIPDKTEDKGHGYKINKAGLCTAHCVAHGTCVSGRCQCDSGYYGTYCTKECTTIGNACTENGGTCREKCNENEVHLNTVTCSDESCNLKCCYLYDTLVQEYDQIWRWNQCSHLPPSVVGNLGECIDLCLERDGCTAMNYGNLVHGKYCMLLTCDPVPEPAKNKPLYNGYKLKKAEVCAVYCNHGSCEDGTCNCDSGFEGKFCTES